MAAQTTVAVLLVVLVCGGIAGMWYLDRYRRHHRAPVEAVQTGTQHARILHRAVHVERGIKATQEEITAWNAELRKEAERMEMLQWGADVRGVIDHDRPT